MDEYIPSGDTRYVFRISKFVILTYKNTIIISLSFFRILLVALASCYLFSLRRLTIHIIFHIFIRKKNIRIVKRHKGVYVSFAFFPFRNKPLLLFLFVLTSLASVRSIGRVGQLSQFYIMIRFSLMFFFVFSP